MNLQDRVIQKRMLSLNLSPASKEVLVNKNSLEYAKLCANNIEKFVGVATLPIGLAGPIKIIGQFANGEFYLPMATTEGALVASYDRGSRVITLSGGVNTIIIDRGIKRSPGFVFKSLIDAQNFTKWVRLVYKQLKETAENTTNHGKLKDIEIFQNGLIVVLIVNFYSANAAGQNMVTIATESIVHYIRNNSPIQIETSSVEMNFSSDKKASYQSMLGVRGRKVSGEITIPEQLINKYLHTSSEKLEFIYEYALELATMAGYIGNQMHYANALAALYIACGQDAACVAESAVGITKFKKVKGGIKVSCTMPNIVVGSVGGGTKLPTQKACLEILEIDPEEDGSADKLAEIILSACLAGEISLVSAAVSDHFVAAHERHGRNKRSKICLSK